MMAVSSVIVYHSTDSMNNTLLLVFPGIALGSKKLLLVWVSLERKFSKFFSMATVFISYE